MKLKTLKDLEEENDEDTMEEYELSEKERYWVYSNKLRQEAVKWIREIEKSLNIGEALNAKDAYRDITYKEEGQIEWIKHFFNITEEEIEK